MKIKAPVPWFGAKRTLAPEIVRELGRHSAYWEPFCGSMAVLFAKPLSSHEIVNDLHGDLVNLAFVLRDAAASQELYKRLSRVVCCEALFDDTLDKFMADPEVEIIRSPSEEQVARALDFFVLSWMGNNGIVGMGRKKCSMAIRWTRNGGSGPTRFRNAVDSIPDWHERLRSVLILNRDAMKVLDTIEDQTDVAIYVDPPYFVETRGKGGKSRYLHDFEEQDHIDLASRLSEFRKARVVVSYYDDPRLDELFSGWTKRRLDVNRNLSVVVKRESEMQRAPEVLLINGPSLVESQETQTLWNLTRSES